MSSDDDDPLTWDDGTDDATHVDAAPAAEPVTTADAPLTGSASLVIYGVLGGLYLLSTVGWIIAAGRDTYTVPNLLGEIMYQLGQFLAIAAPALWFVATFQLTRARSIPRRIAWLVAGTLLLAPWPFILAQVAA